MTKAASKNKSKKSFKVSPEASEGTWTSSGSNWMFLVDGNAYTGWLTDTDGKRYYFDENGIMQTGWVDVDGKRYYMDLDGIMQTGDITIGKKSYHLNDDGSLEGYKAKKTSKKKSSKEKNRKILLLIKLQPFPVQILTAKNTLPSPLTTALVLLQTDFWTVWRKITQRPLSSW